jgi:hypothetical protein
MENWRIDVKPRTGREKIQSVGVQIVTGDFFLRRSGAGRHRQASEWDGGWSFPALTPPRIRNRAGGWRNCWSKILQSSCGRDFESKEMKTGQQEEAMWKEEGANDSDTVVL